MTAVALGQELGDFVHDLIGDHLAHIPRGGVTVHIDVEWFADGDMKIGLAQPLEIFPKIFIAVQPDRQDRCAALHHQGDHARFARKHLAGAAAGPFGEDHQNSPLGQRIRILRKASRSISSPVDWE